MRASTLVMGRSTYARYFNRLRQTAPTARLAEIQNVNERHLS